MIVLVEFRCGKESPNFIWNIEIYLELDQTLLKT